MFLREDADPAPHREGSSEHLVVQKTPEVWTRLPGALPSGPLDEVPTRRNDQTGESCGAVWSERMAAQRRARKGVSGEILPFK